MNVAHPYPRAAAQNRPKALIIGAGIGGLACAVRLAAAGVSVEVIERHAHSGGKIRTTPSRAGPVDAGPTVLTMRHVFDALFATAGARLDDHVTLIPQDILARHFWPDGSRLDLMADRATSIRAVSDFAGSKAGRQFEAFCIRCEQLFATFDAPMMRTAEPSPLALAKHVLSKPAIVPQMAPLSTLARSLSRQFDDPRLAQLFGRYATYVGGSPFRSPSLLSLIWQAEAAGVWVVKGGMHKLADALAELAARHGARFRHNSHVERITLEGGHARAVHLDDGTRLTGDFVVFNGDPRALASGLLGPAVNRVAPQTVTTPRSFSARVLSFAAQVSGPDLAHHNVFFAEDARSEFDDLAAGRIPSAPTLYLCSEDRGQGQAPAGIERFEMIANAPANDPQAAKDPEEIAAWHRMILQTMAAFGVHFDPTPQISEITTPEMFGQMFPGSQGALYGQSPHGLMAAFQRPTARTPIPGLYLTGGGAHPGAGVPMATLSAQHAAEAILSDLTSTSTWAPTAMRGGMSMA